MTRNRWVAQKGLPSWRTATFTSNPASNFPGIPDILRSFSSAQGLDDAAAVPVVLGTGLKRNMPFGLELVVDLAIQGLLVGFHCQEEVGPPHMELVKSTWWVWRASPSEKASPIAWIDTPSRWSWAETAAHSASIHTGWP